VLAGTGFLLVQVAAILKDGEDDQVVTLTTWSGNDLRRFEGTAASEESQSTELAPAVPTDWHADG
jgi:hypothetical protein